MIRAFNIISIEGLKIRHFLPVQLAIICLVLEKKLSSELTWLARLNIHCAIQIYMKMTHCNNFFNIKFCLRNVLLLIENVIFFLVSNYPATVLCKFFNQLLNWWCVIVSFVQNKDFICGIKHMAIRTIF